MAGVLKGLGVEGEAAARAFHSFASFMVGAVLLAAERKAADEQLELAAPSQRKRSRPSRSTAARPTAPDRAPLSIEQIVDLSTADPALDEALFEDGLRRLVKSFSPTS